MSHIKNIIPKTVNPDLIKERSGATFDVEEFAAWWQGSVEKLKTKREIGKSKCISNDSRSLLLYQQRCYQSVFDKNVQL